MNQPKKIRTLYHYWARYYDWFLKYWNKFFVSKAEKDLNNFLKMNLSKNPDILDLACGTGQNITRLKTLKAKPKSYTAVDLSTDMQSRAKDKATWIKNETFIIDDVTKYNPGQKFDLIICTWALSHLNEPQNFLKKYLKHLKKGGIFALIFQGEFKKISLLNKILFPFQKWLQARQVADKSIAETISKAAINEKYLDGYVRLLIFKN